MTSSSTKPFSRQRPATLPCPTLPPPEASVCQSGSLYGWGWGRYGNLGLGDRNDCMLLERVSMVNNGKLPSTP
ncbi:ultraviolet-B receptor UVR8-like [Pyrus ussuriensis x Pyrus communis]|uniref:Ultraviolet-B receptor UVR8-like n=1 Tax=Pyrus ussuriensis x Pyrus communis TaxID=2448454 RepID=A0A5N5FKX4_9ROSA|nr:ultraviolet-B receptor UVR8-like [Pyrus ussuriensis x Pyrus communis]